MLIDKNNEPSPKRRARRGHGRVTLHDIADQAGVTRITVSRYLRAPEQVAPETAQRIQLAVDALGYVPNHQAGQLASGQSKVVAAFIPNIGNSIFAETIHGLAESLTDSGYELMLMSTGYSLDREASQLRAVMGWSPAALIVTGRQHAAATLQLLTMARKQGTPVIQLWDFNEDEPPSEFIQVGFNHGRVGKAMAEHFLARGHRHLGFIDSAVTEDFRAHERASGFCAHVRSQGAQVSLWTAPIGDPIDAGREMIRRWQRDPANAPTALAFANDLFACGALMQATEAGIDVPEQLALLGFGDFPFSRHLPPGLSTMRPPRDIIGSTAGNLVLASLLHGEPIHSTKLPCELVERGSS